MKKIIIFLCFILMCGCGKESDVVENNSDSLTNSTNSFIEKLMEDKSAEEGKPVFSTEYQIEDYCHGCYIVSKNDGMLYGVLDRNGNEIVPVRYDDIDFLNEKEIKSGKDNELYMQTRYEKEYAVITENGHQILDKQVEYIPYELGDRTENSYCFVSKNDMKPPTIISLYKQDGSFISDIDCSNLSDANLYTDDELFYTGIIGVSEDCYILNLGSGDGTSDNPFWFYAVLMNKENQIIYSWPVLASEYEVIDNEFILHMATNQKYTEYESYIIDLSGNIQPLHFFWDNEKSKYRVTESGKLSVKIDSILNSGEYVLFENENAKLYESNETWKLVDAQGNPLYDERYYQCAGADDGYCLMNENNEVCLIDKNGRMLIGYGYLTYSNEMIYFMGGSLKESDVFVGDDGVSIKHGSEVYFFEAK